MSRQRERVPASDGVYIANWEGFLTAGAAIFACCYFIGREKGWSLYDTAIGVLACYFWVLLWVLLVKVSHAPAHAQLTVALRKRYRSRILAAYVLICALLMGLFVFRSGRVENLGLWLMFGVFYGIQLVAGVSEARGANRYEPGMPPSVTAIYSRLSDEQRLGRLWRGKRRWWL